ncbi:MAG TPA: hypothetical protein PKE38_06930 [Ignavibacteriaceae bacterium]|nr:hypothetical protein [Ignavibacteriaceae bacterium]HRN26227.1 hypothetical protein [Ignavibacteriaceae bacterium]
MTKVYHSEIFGLRETKYDWLNKHNIKNVKWKKIVPHPEFYLFIPTDNKLTNQYYSFFKITEIFPVNSVGIVTARDNFVIDFDRKKLERRIEDFRNSKMDNEIIKQTYDINENQSWKIKEQREKLKKDLDWKDSITQIHYRPFDVRWILYHDEMIERSRKEVMIHMLDENIGLIARRQMLPNKPMNYFFISDKMIADGIIRSDNKGSESLFPLYIYLKSSGKKKQKLTQLLMFEPDEEYHAIMPNISREVIDVLSKSYQRDFQNPLDKKKEKGFGSKEIFYYIYAVLYSNTYRNKYAEFLKIDFPRIPFTIDYKLFIQLGKLGEQLADLHLLKSKELDKTISKFPIDGSNRVEKPIFRHSEPVSESSKVTKRGMLKQVQHDKMGKVWINKEQYFDGIKEQVWQYQIGGYQVCEKWLKDRKDRTLTLDEIKTYCKIVTALSITIELQNEIDKIFNKVIKTV